MDDRAFPNAVCGRTGAGLRKVIGGEKQATKRTIRRAKPKPSGRGKKFPFHAAERSARECRGTFARMEAAPIRKRR
jgi:hypothetical protein